MWWSRLQTSIGNEAQALGSNGPVSLVNLTSGVGATAVATTATMLAPPKMSRQTSGPWAQRPSSFHSRPNSLVPQDAQLPTSEDLQVSAAGALHMLSGGSNPQNKHE